MKLALLFLTVFISTSYQQQFQNVMNWMPHQVESPYYRGYSTGSPDFTDSDDGNGKASIEIFRSIEHENQPALSSQLHEPLYRSSPALDYYITSFRKNYYDRLSNNLFLDSHPSSEELYFRHPAAGVGVVNQQQDALFRKNLRPGPMFYPPSHQQRFLFNAFPFNLLFSNAAVYFPKTTSGSSLLFGRTSGIIVTRTVNTVSFQTCVARSEFSSPTPTLCGSGSSGRRRRADVEQADEQLLQFNDQDESSSLVPSPVEKIATTLVEELIEENSKLAEFLAASKDDLVIEDGNRREERSPFFYATTTTFTSFIFSANVVTRTLQVLKDGVSSALLCIRSDVVLCSP